MRQLTIFDFMESELENFPLETVVDMIGNALGLEFKWNDFLKQYEAKIKQYIVDVNYLRYETLDERDGKRFISVGIGEYHGGCSAPTDSIDEAIDFLKAAMKNRDLLREPMGDV